MPRTYLRRSGTDSATTRTCGRCRRTLPVERFPRHAGVKGGRSYTCSECGYRAWKRSARKRRAKRRAAGLCIVCGTTRTAKPEKSCEACKLRVRQRLAFVRTYTLETP